MFIADDCKISKKCGQLVVKANKFWDASLEEQEKRDRNPAI